MVKLEIHVVQKVEAVQGHWSVVHIAQLFCGFSPPYLLTDFFQLWTDGGFNPQKAFVSKQSHPFQRKKIMHNVLAIDNDAKYILVYHIFHFS